MCDPSDPTFGPAEGPTPLLLWEVEMTHHTVHRIWIPLLILTLLLGVPPGPTHAAGTLLDDIEFA